MVGIGSTQLRRRRADHLACGARAMIIGVTATIRGFCLLVCDAGGWQTWLAWTMLVGGVLGALLLAVSTGRLKKLAVASVLIGSITAAAGMASFTVAKVASGHTGSTPTDLLNATSTRWSAAVLRDQSASGYILSTNTAVMAIGGWSGSDDAPTLGPVPAVRGRRRDQLSHRRWRHGWRRRHGL